MHVVCLLTALSLTVTHKSRSSSEKNITHYYDVWHMEKGSQPQKGTCTVTHRSVAETKASHNFCLLTEMGHTVALLVLIFIFVLQSEAGISEKYFYNRPGDDVILPCDSVSSSDTCSSVYWLFSTERSDTIFVVMKGNVVMNSARAARLRLYSNCSLLISNITAEDAGVYSCRQGKIGQADNLFLNILTISPSPPDADQQRDDEVTLRCSLLRYRNLPLCVKNRVRWVDETEAELPGIQNDSVHHTDCVSVLKVKRQSGNNKRYTCQFVDKRNSVMIQTDFTPFITDALYVINAAVVGVVVLVVLVGVTVVLIKCRKRTKVTEGVRKPIHHSDEPEVNLTYITVSHDNQRASPERRVKQEENVTYSTIKTL